MIDPATRWTETVPLKDMGAESVMRAFLLGWVAGFGVLELVTTDWGVQFTSGL